MEHVDEALQEVNARVEQLTSTHNGRTDADRRKRLEELILSQPDVALLCESLQTGPLRHGFPL